MNRRLFGLTLIFVVGILACDVTSLAPTAVPTLTPDRIATGVAEQKAIAATLTKEAPAATQTPSPSKTPEPTITRLLPSPTATFTRANTPTSTPTREGKLVQGSVYGYRVVSVEKADSYATTFYPTEKYAYPESGYVFLEVGVELYKNGVLSWDDNEQLELSLLDSKGNVYTMANRDFTTKSFTLDRGKTTSIHYSVYFSVPNTAAGFKLQYRDLPPIDLGL